MSELTQVSYKLTLNQEGKIFADSVEFVSTVAPGETDGPEANFEPQMDSALIVLNRLRLTAESALAAIHRDRARRDAKPDAESPKAVATPSVPGGTNLSMRPDGYIPNLKRWIFHQCKPGVEPNFDINTATREGKPYQRCRDCGVYLNDNGSTREMKKQ